MPRMPSLGSARLIRLTTGVAAVSLASGCGLVLGLGDFEDSPALGATTSTGGSGQGGAGGNGQQGGGGSGPCAKGDTRPCYTGAAGTQDVGVCIGGMQTCGDDLAWGPCDGEKTPAMEDCSQPEDEDCDHVSCSELVWAKQFGDTEPQLAIDSAVDSDGGIVLTGVFGSSINFGPTSTTTLISSNAGDIYLAKLDAAGGYLWSKSFSGGGDGDVPTSVAVDRTSGQIFLTGVYKIGIDFGGGPLTSTDNQDFFIASFDKNGNHLWSHTYGLSASAFASDLAATPDGDVVVVGRFEGGPISLGSQQLGNTGMKDGFVAKLSGANGAEIWSHSYGDYTGYPIADQEARSVAVDTGGNIVVAGTTTGSIDFGSGFSDFGSHGLRDVFVVRLGAGGGPTWHCYFYGPDETLVAGVAVDSTGSSYILGYFSGSTSFEGTDFGPTKMTTGASDLDMFVVKLNSAGKHGFTKQFGDSVSQVDLATFGGITAPFAAALDSKDNLVLGGGFLGTIKPGAVDLVSAGDSDWFLAKFASDGTPLWSRSNGDAALLQALFGVGVDHQTDQILVHGTNDGSLQLSASTKLTTAGSIDVVAAKFQP